MAANILQMLSPGYVGEERITIQVAETSKPLLTSKTITLEFDYGDSEPADIAIPLELIIQPGFGSGGNGSGYTRKVFRRNAPTSFTFRLPGAGTYLASISEQFHNRWWGRLLFTVGGDQFSQVELGGRE